MIVLRAVHTHNRGAFPKPNIDPKIPESLLIGIPPKSPLILGPPPPPPPPHRFYPTVTGWGQYPSYDWRLMVDQKPGNIVSKHSILACGVVMGCYHKSHTPNLNALNQPCYCYCGRRRLGPSSSCSAWRSSVPWPEVASTPSRGSGSGLV